MIGISAALVLAAPGSGEADATASLVPPVAPAPDAAAEPAIDDDMTPGDIVVTATRQVLRADQVASSVTVLNREAIERSQDIGVSELLLRTPGVSMSRNGGYGTATSLRIRGAESDQTVVVIDGVKLNDPASAGGGYNFANLLIGDASRIEVLRGPQSILWGSQAIGGVVSIVTALPQRDLEMGFDIEAGSRETVSARAAIGGRTGPVTWRIGAQAFTTEGISAIAAANGGGEPDGYRNRNVSGRVEVAITDNMTLDLRSYYLHGRTDIDNPGGDNLFAYAQNQEFVGYAGLNVDLLGGRFRNRIAIGYTDTDRTNFDTSRQRAESFDSAGSNRRFEYQGNFAIAEGWSVLVGAEYEQSEFRSVSPPAALSTPVPAPARGDTSITSFYGQLRASPVAGLTLTGGIRNDDHSRSGGQALFGAGAVYALPWNMVLRASYGEGFKAATLYQLFSEYGNQALRPEQAEGWEAAVEQRLFADRLVVGATWFERTTADQIVFNSCAASSTNPLCLQPGSTIRRSGYYLNVARAKAHGIEAAAAVRIGDRLSIDGNYSWIVAEDRSSGTANFGKWLPRRPRQAANASITYAFPFGLSLAAAARYSGEAYDDAANARRLDDYVLVDLRAEYAISPRLRVFARVENIFDEVYQTAFRYGTLGRSIEAGVRGRF